MKGPWTFTRHFEVMWKKRFPLLDALEELGSARKMNSKQKIKLRLQVPYHAHMIQEFKGHYYIKSRNNVVFVVAAPDTVITAFLYLNGDLRRLNYDRNY